MPAASVRLQSQLQRTRLLPSGRTEEVVEVTFMVGEDGPFIVDVPVDFYSAETVAQRVGSVADAVAQTRQQLG